MHVYAITKKKRKKKENIVIYWFCITQNDSLSYEYFIDWIPEIARPFLYEGKVEDQFWDQ